MARIAVPFCGIEIAQDVRPYFVKKTTDNLKFPLVEDDEKQGSISSQLEGIVSAGFSIPLMVVNLYGMQESEVLKLLNNPRFKKTKFYLFTQGTPFAKVQKIVAEREGKKLVTLRYYSEDTANQEKIIAKGWLDTELEKRILDYKKL